MHYFLDKQTGTLHELIRGIHNKEDFLNEGLYEHFFNLTKALEAQDKWRKKHATKW